MGAASSHEENERARTSAHAVATATRAVSACPASRSTTAHTAGACVVLHASTSAYARAATRCTCSAGTSQCPRHPPHHPVTSGQVHA